MEHSLIILSLFSPVSLFAVTSPSPPLHSLISHFTQHVSLPHSLCLSPLRMMGNAQRMGMVRDQRYGFLTESALLFVPLMCVYVVLCFIEEQKGKWLIVCLFILVGVCRREGRVVYVCCISVFPFEERIGVCAWIEWQSAGQQYVRVEFPYVFLQM